MDKIDKSLKLDTVDKLKIWQSALENSQKDIFAEIEKLPDSEQEFYKTLWQRLKAGQINEDQVKNLFKQKNASQTTDNR